MNRGAPDADVELATSIRIVEHDGNYLHIRFGGLNTASQGYIATAASVTSQAEEIFDIAARNPDVTPDETGFDPTPVAWG